MIPKKIHYVWVGDQANIPNIELEWIEETKRLHPDYEIKMWTEKDVPECEFMTHALSQKLYSYVADYIRCWVLYNEGGFYLDTDIKMLKKIPNEWTWYEAALPRETGWYISSFIMGSVLKGRLIKAILKLYTDAKDFEGPLDTEEWMPAELWKPVIIQTYGLWSVNSPQNGKWSTAQMRFKAIEEHEACPYYPWDEKRVNELVDTSQSVCIHYWNNYKKDKDIPFESFGTKFFDK